MLRVTFLALIFAGAVAKEDGAPRCSSGSGKWETVVFVGGTLTGEPTHTGALGCSGGGTSVEAARIDRASSHA